MTWKPATQQELFSNLKSKVGSDDSGWTMSAPRNRGTCHIQAATEDFKTGSKLPDRQVCCRQHNKKVLSGARCATGQSSRATTYDDCFTLLSLSELVMFEMGKRGVVLACAESCQEAPVGYVWIDLVRATNDDTRMSTIARSPYGPGVWS